MNKHLIPMLLGLSLLLSGCQLAKEEASNETVVPMITDQVAGMLVTMGSVGQMPDEEAIHTFANEGKKIYAALVEETYEKSDGTQGIYHEFQFPEGSGMAYMGYLIQDEMTPEEPDGGTCASTIDEGIYPDGLVYQAYNDLSFVELEGIIYVAETAGDLTLYMNPVYQSPDGAVYALGTAPMGYHATSMDGCSVRYGVEVEQTQGQITQSQTGFVKMTIEVIRLPQHYTIVQMDENNQVLDKSHYAPEEMPEEFTPVRECAYLILECESMEKEVERTVYSPDDSSHALKSFYPLENGICVRGHTTIHWEGVR